MLEDLGEPTECRKSPKVTTHEKNIPFDRKFGLLPVLHVLGVGDVPAGTNDGELTPPNNLHDGKGRPIELCLGVPVPGNQEHVLTDMDARFVNGGRRPSPAVLALHIDVAEVPWGFVDWDIRIEADDLPTGPQRSEVITFNKSSGLPIL